MVFLVQRTMWWLLEMKYGLVRRLSGSAKNNLGVGLDGQLKGCCPTVALVQRT